MSSSQLLHSPISWFGGKGRMHRRILDFFPPHRTYVEPFGGGASLLFAKKPSLVEVYNDVDKGLVNFFRVLRDPELFAEFERRISSRPCSRYEYEVALNRWEDEDIPVQQACYWYILSKQSFGGKFGSGWGFDINYSTRGMAGQVSKWLHGIEGLSNAHNRLIRVQIECLDWRHILSTYNTHETLAYCDPPYLLRLRSSGKYKHELKETDHIDLIDCLKTYEGMVLLSGYKSDLYCGLEDDGWVCHRWQTSSHAAGRGRGSGEKQARVECLWINPKAQAKSAQQALF